MKRKIAAGILLFAAANFLGVVCLAFYQEPKLFVVRFGLIGVVLAIVWSINTLLERP